ncbi:hypothetical protein BKA82DRAFT_15653 [Pisolithus tinctorius]|uniref:Sacsin/Nov domain-containing protein n=1 Tax=Pisolithus tinctorius Marx 270 TaxID=870435 RepID=A0A0C3NSM5_PISTI|nr:hypothetical protein BKA82DRAFT_15653 [Pisolithus tinctorius]KIO03830.1 hypothetical protein M404DRAFT_15653 [Pisolithus tinctorius Marx 270]
MLPEHAPVTVDMRALVDKVLARYSGEFTVFRELLQNSDDAGCDTAEIRFETAAFLGLDPEPVMNAGPPVLPDLKTTNVAQWTFKNHGKPFRPEDWDRLPKIAMGNTDPRKVGAFGVGFYSVFSVTESPYVSSGDKEMSFSWNDKNQLYYRFSDLPQPVTRDLWTTFKMPLREAAPMPSVSEFMQFLATSITFMAHLEGVTVFFDHHRVGKINKFLSQPQAIPIPTELEPSSPENVMTVKSIQQYPITIKAEIMLSRDDPTRMPEAKVDLNVFTAEVDVTVDEKLSKELNRCMKKNPPSTLKYSVIYTEKDEYEQSCMNEQKQPCEFPSVFRGLRADLDRATHTRVFIGHATSQTTGIGGHMASHFIPTVERESIDLVTLTYPCRLVWNRELLYVGGVLCRAVYEWELSKIESLWEEAAAGNLPSQPLRELQDQRFLHILRFFSFRDSTPSPKVADLLMGSFYGCSPRPLRLLSSIGVRCAPDVRAFDPVVAKFLKSLPMLSEEVTRACAHSNTALPGQHKIPTIRPPDVLQDLRRHTLDVEELVACLRWWITLTRDDLTSSTPDLLLDAVTLRGAGGAIRLSSITYFIDPTIFGLHIPPDGPLPLSVIPPRVSERFSCEELTSFGWREFSVTSWLQHISCPDVLTADKKYDFTRSDEWASRVLSTLCRVWPQLSEDMRGESREVFRNKPCIPTSKGLYCPEFSCLPVADNALFHHLDLPVVNLDSGFEVGEDMKMFLPFIGVRKNPPVQLLLDQMLLTGDWTVFNLVDYLVQKESELTSKDVSALKSSEIFMSERFQGNEENIRYRADELYPPVDTFRRLRLPVIEWELEWRDTSPQAQLLYRLGLNHFPTLPTIVELCSSGDVGIQETAFEYLCSELHRHYRDYKPERFRDVDFIPAESNGSTCLKKFGEVYSGTQWKALGFFVVQGRYMRAPLHELGVTRHPPTSKLLDLLEKTPPPDEETARHWFEVLFGHMANFLPSDFKKLSGLPIVPTGSLSALKFLPPTKCYLDQGTKPKFYAQLFTFVNFGPEANHFLSACYSNNKVSIQDVAEVLTENPERFLQLAGGYDGFLAELRKLAYQSQDISNDTLHKMSHRPTLLGVRRKKREGQDVWDDEHKLLTSQEMTIVDDTIDYQLFIDCLFVAPQDEVLERFYASLGCRRLSTVIEERCNDLHEIPPTKTCREVQSLILKRLPLFIRNYPDTKPKIEIPSSPDHLKVKACERIRVSKVLVTGNVELTRDVWAIARCKDDCIEVWISKTAKRDMYEVATSLCRLLFGTNRINALLHLEMILSADPELMQRRRFLVDQIYQRHRDGYGVENKAREKRPADSVWTTNSPKQSTLGTQPDPQLGCERPPGSSEAAPQFPSLPRAVDSVLLKICEAFVSSDTVGHSTSLPLSWTSREVIPQSYIRKPLNSPYNEKRYLDSFLGEKAIEACSLGGNKLAIHMEVSRFLQSGFYKVPANVGSLQCIGQLKNIRIWAAEGTPDTDTFMERMHGPLARFGDIIITLSEIYRVPTKMLHIFYDVSGGCIAFNRQGIIYLNLRYFEVWHDEQVKTGNRQNARMSWFLTLAHEIAHNLTSRHNSTHEFWVSAICEAHLVPFSQLLRPANTWPRYVLWLSFVVIVVLFSYLAPMINILH